MGMRLVIAVDTPLPLRSDYSSYAPGLSSQQRVTTRKEADMKVTILTAEGDNQKGS